jgi:3-hydroxy-3-methylglutaryl CoA synthase/uncharacterized OB-fold protein
LRLTSIIQPSGARLSNRKAQERVLANGIIGCGAYAPASRMSRAAMVAAMSWAQPAVKGYGVGARAFGAWDEDPITMAVEAAREAMAFLSSSPERLCFASTTAPFLDRLNAGVVAAALDLPATTHASDAAGSQRAATSALIALAEGGPGVSLLVTGERRPVAAGSALEFLCGDAGAALALGPGDGIARIVGATSIVSDFVDHFRTAQSGCDYVLEERWFRDVALATLAPAAVSPLLERCGVRPESIDMLIAPTPNPALARSVADALGMRREAIAPSLFETCGHAGAAHPVLMLAAALERARPEDWILLLGFGQGCDAILIRTTRDLAARRPDSFRRREAACIVEDNYVRFLAASGRVEIDWGMRAERDNRTAQTVAYNRSRDVYGFVGGQCSACLTPQFPKARRCVNPECRALDTQSPYRFADRMGRIKSYTEDWLAFTRDPPLCYGNVDFDGGGAVFMEMTGFKPGALSVGAPVRMQFRIKDFDAARGFRRYFWKAAPAFTEGVDG